MNRKTTKNLKNRIDVELVNNQKDYLKCTSKPSYILHKIFDNNLVVIRKSKLALKLNKPVYIGMCILELSKVLMYEFPYDHINKKQDSKSKLQTGTDSLIYGIKAENTYEVFRSNKEMFDFSNYSTKSKCYDDSNKLIFGNMKK